MLEYFICLTRESLCDAEAFIYLTGDRFVICGRFYIALRNKRYM